MIFPFIKKYLIFSIVFVFPVTLSGQTKTAKTDSSFWYLSLPELQSYKAYYTQEILQLQQEKMNLINRGIEDGEKLLASRPDKKVLDGILARLANLYYYKEKNEYLQKMEDYDKALILYEKGKLSTPPEEPKLTFDKSLNIYQRIIDEFSGSKLIDDAIYNKAFLYEEMNRHKEANQIYLHLIEAYPNSPYVPESYMRLGEYYFNPPVNDLEKAVKYYKNVLKYKNSPRYDEAVYKIGWSYYRLSRYPEAISYFTTLVEDMISIKKHDPGQFKQRIDLTEESLEYIAISFIDYGGSEKAVQYLKGIGSPDWGADVLEKLGDVYLNDKEEYLEAVSAYNKFLEYAPFSEHSPSVQQKIVTCYQILEREEDVFFARQKLFLNYKPSSNWWQKVESARARQTALNLSEKAVRANFNSLIRKAEKESDQDIFREAVNLGRTYLNEFPENINAYYVRWNVALILDTRLHQYKDALQEYLTISLVYNSTKYDDYAREKGLSTFKDAAENAIVVADSLVQQERRTRKISVKTNGDEKAAEPLTPAESWLAMAYDNYLKLFPFDPNTPKVLASAGALYYTHNQFSEALKYFKTLVKYFPQSNELHNVQYSIMESYFGKKDFTSAEVLAKRMLEQDIPDSMKVKVRKRLGEAIFFKAQALAEEGQKKQAADEFYRMAVETPKIEFADRALFNAGKEFDNIGNFDSAVRAYELLRISYGDSPFLKPALNNLAIDYGQLKEYAKGAKIYDELYKLLTKGDEARDALYNTIIYLEKCSDWVGALEKSSLYASEYKESPDAPEIFFKRGNYLLALQDTAGAVNFYHNFSDTFPQSPLNILAAYKEGIFSLKLGWENRGENAFVRSYVLWQAFKGNGSEKYNFYVSKGLFLAAQIAEKRFDSIEFLLPMERLKNLVMQKKALMDTVISRYTNVITFSDSRLPEAIFKIGLVKEHFTETWASQEMPEMDPTQYAVRKKEINQETTQLYKKALSAYQKSAKVLDKLYSTMNNKTVSEKPSGSTSEDSVSQDSIKILTGKWLSRSKIKVTEVLFDLAEVNRESIQQLLNAPFPEGLSALEKTEYRSQLLIKAIKPLVDLVVSAHYKNIQVSDSLNVETKWTRASRNMVIDGLTFLPGEFEDLTFDALRYFNFMRNRYTDKVLNKKQEVSLDSINAAVNMLEVSSNYAKAVLVLLKNSIEKAQKTGVADSLVMELQKSFVDFSLSLSDTVDILVKACLSDHEKADSLFNSTGETIYEDALAVYEDDVYFLQNHLKDVLEKSIAIEDKFNFKTPRARWLEIKLVLLDPDNYSKKFNVTVETVSIKPDSSWKYKLVVRKVRNRNDQKWKTYADCMSDSTFWLNDTLTISYGDTVVSVQDVDTLLVMKMLQINGIPINGKIMVPSGEGIAAVFNKKTLKKESYETEYPIDSLIKKGENQVLVGLLKRRFLWDAPVVYFRYIPDWALPIEEE
ncbi:hypothetical protein DRQ07_01465 [candidate division KSB1 bacterium]|nr:MAG: hypothetical protein DRQ07_01465 [candidate division KSB1 bacterium]